MATGENRVRWELLDPTTYEDMVAVLLSYRHPDLVRIDGKGGDGGRDCYWDTDRGREAAELKSFTGRMDKSRRSQVVRSLKRAAAHKPVVWELVVPIDPTPKEEKWFDGLRQKYSFPLTWRGKTWLDGQMARHPYVHRYFVEGAADEVIARLAELSQEQTALEAGVPEAAERLEAIRTRLGELDPYFTFSVSVGPQGRRIEIHPRYAGAARDRPITGKVSFSFPDTAEGAESMADLENAIDFGLPFRVDPENVDAITVNAPAGVGGTFSGGSVSFFPVSNAEIGPLRITVLDPLNHVIASLPMTVTSHTHGIAGATLSAEDRSGFLRLTVRVLFDNGKVELTYRSELEGPALPADLAPPLTLLAHMHSPNMLRVELLDPPAVLVDGVPLDADPNPQGEQQTIIQRLAALQARTGVFFELPDHLTSRDLAEIDEGFRLISGETVPMNWPSITLHIDPGGSESQVVKNAADEDQWIGGLVTRSTIEVAIGDHVLSLGRAVTVYPAIRIANREEVLQAWDNEDAVRVVLECVKQPLITLGESPPEPESD